MHATALRTGELFFRLYWRDGMRRILDIGSRDVNGSLRSVAPADSEYLGIDMEPGNGVDIVPKDPYEWPLRDAWFDAVVSTSCFEPDEFLWLTCLEALRVLRPGGSLFINVPASGGYHGFPGDCWRFYPDSARAGKLAASVRAGCQPDRVLQPGPVPGDFPGLHHGLPLRPGTRAGRLHSRADGRRGEHPHRGQQGPATIRSGDRMSRIVPAIRRRTTTNPSYSPFRRS